MVLAGVQKDLEDYLHKLEEAEKGTIENLKKKWTYFTSEKKVPDLYFGMKKDGYCSKELVEYMRMKQRLAEYKKINTPELLDKTLWEKSGHWDKFGEHMTSPSKLLMKKHLQLNYELPRMCSSI